MEALTERVGNRGRAGQLTGRRLLCDLLCHARSRL